MPKLSSRSNERRTFLKSIAAAGGAAALAAVAGPAAAGSAEGATQDGSTKPRCKGYRETAHVAAYYESLRG